MVALVPAYSHGGSGSSTWPAIPGTAVGAGNPISLLSGQGAGDGMIRCYNHGTASVVFVVEDSEGALTAGAPPSSSWQVIPLTWSQQTIQLDAGEAATLFVGGRGPWIRTRITAITTGGSLESYINVLQLTKGTTPVSAQNPLLSNNATEGL